MQMRLLECPAVPLLALVLLCTLGCVAPPSLDESGKAIGGNPRLRAAVNYISELHKRNASTSREELASVRYSMTICPLLEPFSMSFVGRADVPSVRVPGDLEIMVPVTMDRCDSASITFVLVFADASKPPLLVTRRLYWDDGRWVEAGTFRMSLQKVTDEERQ
jgi:hypothetical protein